MTRLDVFRLPSSSTAPAEHIDRIYGWELPGLMAELGREEPHSEWKVEPVDPSDEVL